MGIDSSNERIRQAREKSGLAPETLAAQVGITVPWYHDLEARADEVATTLSLEQLDRLASALDMSLAYLVLGGEAAGPRSSADQLAAEVVNGLKQSGASAAQISATIGWDVAPLWQRPDELWRMNLDGARAVCDFAGVDWRALLAARQPDGSRS